MQISVWFPGRKKKEINIEFLVLSFFKLPFETAWTVPVTCSHLHLVCALGPGTTREQPGANEAGWTRSKVTSRQM